MTHVHTMEVTSLTGYRFIIQGGQYKKLGNGFIFWLPNDPTQTGETLKKGWS